MQDLFCHDMDILRWLIGKRCLSVSSFGGLRIFKKENAPENSADYCSDCSVDCIYKAQKLYTDKKVRSGKLRFVLQKGIGQVVEFTPGVYAKAIEEDAVRDVLKRM